MLRRTIALAIVLISTAALTFAHALDGRWTGSMETPNGDFEITFQFKVDGSKLTGAVEAPNGDIPIEDGKVDGKQFTFKTHLNDAEIDHQGTLNGDTIDLKVQGPWGDSEMTLKRAGEKKPQ